MPTQKQIAANRRNAQKSTGPRTPEGKARSSQNALKSGIDANSQIIRHETPADLNCLKFEYHDRFLPDTPEQRMLVDTLIDCEWLLRRFRRIEAELWLHGMNNQVHQTSLAESFLKTCDAFARLQRRIDATQRTFRNALHELQRLQAAEPQLDPEPDPVTLSPQSANPASGFDPQIAADASRHPPQPEFPPVTGDPNSRVPFDVD